MILSPISPSQPSKRPDLQKRWVLVEPCHPAVAKFKVLHKRIARPAAPWARMAAATG